MESNNGNCTVEVKMISMCEIDGDVDIWRYMEFSKFAFLLCKRALWFARSDLLGDEHEGSLPSGNIKNRNEKWKGEIEERNSVTSEAPSILERMKHGSKLMRENVFVNCWSMNDCESYAMWKIYVPNGAGVVIKSTVERLKNCFVRHPNDLADRFDLVIDKMRYGDYDKIKFNEEKGAVERFFCKKKEYQCERELRAAITFMPTVEEPPRGIQLSVDLGTLIENVLVSPKYSEWLEIIVKDILNKYELSIDVFKSSLSRKPDF